MSAAALSQSILVWVLVSLTSNSAGVWTVMPPPPNAPSSPEPRPLAPAGPGLKIVKTVMAVPRALAMPPHGEPAYTNTDQVQCGKFPRADAVPAPLAPGNGQAAAAADQRED